MSVYGEKIYESADDLNPQSFSEGYLAINEMMRHPITVPIIKEGNKYYVSSESVMNYMAASGVTEIDEALTNIARVNKINKSLLEAVGVFDDDYLSESINENAVLLEKAAEDNAMTLKQAEKYYNAVISNCKSKADTKDTIDQCISLLKQCVKDMEQAKAKAQSSLLDGGRIKYALKSFIPFNGIYRLFKRNDWEAGMPGVAKYGINAASNIVVTNSIANAAKSAFSDAGTAAKAAGKAASVASKANVIGTAVNAVEVGVRLATYTKMLDRMIKNTNEAIDYLQKKRKEMDE